jgi:hypothetical protein
VSKVYSTFWSEGFPKLYIYPTIFGVVSSI